MKKRTYIRIIILQKRERMFWEAGIIMENIHTDKRIEVGSRIRTLRKRHDLSQDKFAEALDISAVTLSRIENGTANLDVCMLLKMTQILAVPVEAILGTRGWQKDKQEVQVACPCCKNKRLLDADPETVEGIIKIKCPVCKSVIAVSFHKKKVHAERIEV